VKSPALAWTLIGLGAASGVASGISFRLREDRVARWNDEGECIPSNGDTREEACGDAKSDAETFQTVGVVTAIAGVVFAGTGVALLLGGSEESGVAADSASIDEGLTLSGCNAGFLSLSCSGSF
jgi:hypothetical protein